MFNSVACPILILKFKSHDTLKHKLLESINTAMGESLIDGEDNISKTDWNIDKTLRRQYLEIIQAPLVEHLKEAYNSIGVGGFEVHNFWYQQYNTNATHSWHTHAGTHYTNIYYLELLPNGPKTQIINPVTQSIEILDVKEGDIVSFPSFIFHKSPPVTENSRKTIISFNTSFHTLLVNPAV